MSGDVQFNSHARQIAEVGRHYTAGDLHLHKLSETGDLVGKTGLSWCLSWILGSIVKLFGYSVQSSYLLEMVPVLLRKMDRSAEGAQPYTASWIGVSTTDEQRVTNRDAYSTYNIYKRLIEDKYTVREEDHILPAVVRDTLPSYNRAYGLANNEEMRSLLVDMRVSEPTEEGGEARHYSSNQFAAVPRSTASIEERNTCFKEVGQLNRRQAINKIVAQKDQLEELLRLVTSGITLLDAVDSQSLAELVDVARAYEPIVHQARVEELVSDPSVRSLLGDTTGWENTVVVSGEKRALLNHFVTERKKNTEDLGISDALRARDKLKELQQLVGQGYKSLKVDEDKLQRLVAIADAYAFDEIGLVGDSLIKPLLSGVIEHPEWIKQVPVTGEEDQRLGYFIGEERGEMTPVVISDVVRAKGLLKELQRRAEQGSPLPEGITEANLHGLLAIADAYAFTSKLHTYEVKDFYNTLITGGDRRIQPGSETYEERRRTEFIEQHQRDILRDHHFIEGKEGKQAWATVETELKDNPELLSKVRDVCTQTTLTAATNAKGLPANLLICSTVLRFIGSEHYMTYPGSRVGTPTHTFNLSADYTRVTIDGQFKVGSKADPDPDLALAIIDYRIEYDTLTDTAQVTFVRNVEFTDNCTSEQRQEIAAICGISV